MVSENLIIDEARQHWEAGQALEAGRILFEHLPEEARPNWAANVLALAARHFPTIPEVENVQAIAKSPDTHIWLEAKEAFHQVRALTLRVERQGPQEQLCFLLLAENTAKLTYNSFRQPAWVEEFAPPLSGFDADAGWWIAANARCIVDALDDTEFTNVPWDTLVAPYRV
ncbi:MAG TPA: hypothetical protein VF952_15545 [Chloroflexia bacterium]